MSLRPAPHRLVSAGVLHRPVGSTIYPGMMVTAATVYHTAEALGMGWSLNDICVFIPAAGGAISSLCTFGLVR